MTKLPPKIHATTQKFTEIKDVIGNIVTFTSGNACLIIEVTATNFSLLSKEEQDAKIFSYSSLLNSLSYPIQIFIRSKRIDISSYLRLLDQEAIKTQNQMLGGRIRLYRDFIQELVRVNTILDKKFYIIISYSHFESGPKTAQAALEKNAKTTLDLKAKSLLSQLQRLNLYAKILEKEELTKLFYEIYNGDLLETNQTEDNVKTLIVKAESNV